MHDVYLTNTVDINNDTCIFDVYITCGHQLAHDAFKVAQSLDPTFISCWIGQVNVTYITSVIGQVNVLHVSF